MKFNVPVNQTDLVVLLVLAVLFLLGIRAVVGFFKPSRKVEDTRRDGEGGTGTRVTVEIDGMMCGMCESHIKDAIRAGFPGVSKLSASHGKGRASFILSAPESESKVAARLHEGIDPLGYRIISVRVA